MLLSAVEHPQTARTANAPVKCVLRIVAQESASWFAEVVRMGTSLAPRLSVRSVNLARKERTATAAKTAQAVNAPRREA